MANSLYDGIAKIDVALLGALLLLTAFQAQAAEPSIVEFSSATTPPTKFQIRRAKSKGINLKAKTGTSIVGKLRAPIGPGPFPALVLLHDCQGIQAYQDQWAQKLNDWGFLTLQVDSFSPRNVTSTCEDVLGEGLSGLGGERVMDSFGALFFLEQHPKADRNRIGAFGWSRSSTTGSALANGSRQYFDRGFKAVISFYPNCKSIASASFADPILILVAGKDDWTTPEICTNLASTDPNVEVIFFKDAFHGFDDPKWGQYTKMPDFQNTLKEPTFGVTLGYDTDTADRAADAIKAYLAKHL